MIYEGSNPVASRNKLLGQFQLINVPPAPVGVPRVKVQCCIAPLSLHSETLHLGSCEGVVWRFKNNRQFTWAKFSYKSFERHLQMYHLGEATCICMHMGPSARKSFIRALKSVINDGQLRLLDWNWRSLERKWSICILLNSIHLLAGKCSDNIHCLACFCQSMHFCSQQSP